MTRLASWHQGRAERSFSVSWSEREVQVRLSFTVFPLTSNNGDTSGHTRAQKPSEECSGQRNVLRGSPTTDPDDHNSPVPSKARDGDCHDSVSRARTRRGQGHRGHLPEYADRALRHQQAFSNTSLWVADSILGEISVPEFVVNDMPHGCPAY